LEGFLDELPLAVIVPRHNKKEHMKQKLLLSFLIFSFITNSFGQKLSLSDLTSLCNKKNWEDVNQFMLIKGWTYYNSEQGSDDKYNTITWSYNKEDYSDKAQGWFYLYTFDNYPNKISYSIFNKTSYLLIQNSLVANGFKLIDSEIEDKRVISTYSNLGYTLKISNSKRTDEDWSERSVTAYSVTLIKKAGIYDSENGKKIDYYDNDVIKAEYTLLNGKINGLLKLYDEFGNLQKTTNFNNGVANGRVVEYKENGEKNAEYIISDDTKNGLLTFYENNKISYTTNFVNDLKNGQHTSYYYNEDDEKLFLKEYGQYIKDKKNGPWKTFYVDGKVEKLTTYTNYLNDVLNGDFQEIKNDSLIIGNYRNDLLNGSYKIYRDLKKILIGGIINTNPNELILVTQGQYSEGRKTGNWKNYDLSKSILNEGNYYEDFKDGEWKNYYPSFIKEDNTKETFSNELYLIENYSNGKLNGKSTRFSNFEDEEYACNETDENGNKIDTCKRKIYVKINEISNFKNNELNGQYELRDSINRIIVKGEFLNDLKNGEFIEKFAEKDSTNTIVFATEKGKYIDGKRSGTWYQYFKENNIIQIINYKNGLFDGENIVFDDAQNPSVIRLYRNDQIISIKRFDLTKNKIQREIKIIQNNGDNVLCNKIEYTENSIISEDFWMKRDGSEVEFEIEFYTKANSQNEDYLYKNGEYILSNLKEEKLIVGNYIKNKKNGLWTYFYYDQNVKIDENYLNNEKNDEVYYKIDGTSFSGEFESIDNEKNIKEIRKIKDGLRNGKTTIIDLKTNKTINKESYKNGKLKE